MIDTETLIEQAEEYKIHSSGEARLICSLAAALAAEKERADGATVLKDLAEANYGNWQNRAYAAEAQVAALREVLERIAYPPSDYAYEPWAKARAREALDAQR